jgi:CDP-paratose 2-epimerase
LAFDKKPIAIIIECSAEPSVLAGFGGSPEYLIHSNLSGAINCLEVARRQGADFVFLSTSRVYPVKKINSLNFTEEETRFSLQEKQPFPGASARGISENFPLDGARSLYGATKLAVELLALEYAEMYGVRTIINRCSVIAGPWQMGKADQGVFTLWMAAFYFRKTLSYIGFGGSGKQVRDVLHVDDLFDLLDRQLNDMGRHNTQIYNVGGGLSNSLSLLETTAICEEITGNTITISREAQTRPADIKSYISDCSKVTLETGWKPQRSPRQVLEDMYHWIHNHEQALKKIL